MDIERKIKIMQTTKTTTYLDHRTFGGIVTEADFFTCRSSNRQETRSQRADRISRDHAFNHWCANYKSPTTRFRERLIRMENNAI